MVWIICSALLCLIAGVPAALLLYRKLRQAKIASALKIENEQGIVEERFIPIGGIEQWISIRGEDRNNPVVLVIHGGPASCYSIFTPHLRSWENHFTIVQWDQRGAGKTFAKMGPYGSGEISMKRLTRDAIEVSEYLRTHLHRDQIFLLASSMGSTFGLQVVRSRPDLFYAYIGTDQNVGMARGREENHRQVLDRLREHGMTKGIKALEQIGSNPTLWTHRDFKIVAQWTMKSDPTGYHRTIKLLKDAVWYAPEWKLRDVRAFVKGMNFSLEQLLPEIVRYDAWAAGTRFEIPIFFFQGENDVLTLPSQAKSYFNDIHAPLKHMEMISDAGHFAAFLQPEQFLEDLLTYVRPLAYASGKRLFTANIDQEAMPSEV
ncbi:MAG: alpha/beta fold hydrolase [Acidobacteriaceae bacterium]